jgi:hypothetical protein
MIYEFFSFYNEFDMLELKLPGTRIAPSPANKDMSYLEFSSWIKTARLYEENEILEILN